MREHNFDVKAFPSLHPTGRYGLHHERDEELSPQKYFGQRLLNEDERYSKDLPYLFMAQHYTERHALESQISIAGQKGMIQNPQEKSNMKKVQLNDVFNVFQRIRGSPKYWETAR